MIKDPETTGHGRDGFYFGITGEHSWYDISQEIGKVLVDLGLHKEAEPETFTREELPTYFGSMVSIARSQSLVVSGLTDATESGLIFRHEFAWCRESFQIYWMEPKEWHARDAC